MGERAFPGGDFRGVEPSNGMTLRDWFAGQALAAVTQPDTPKRVAEWAYMIADAMLTERKDWPA